MQAIFYRIRSLSCAPCSLSGLLYQESHHEWYYNPPPLPQTPICKLYSLAKHEVYYSDGQNITDKTEAFVQSALNGVEAHYGPPYEFNKDSYQFTPYWAADPINEYSIIDGKSSIFSLGDRSIGFFTQTKSKTTLGFPYPDPGLGSRHTEAGSDIFFGTNTFRVSFYPQVAWVDLVGSGHPLTPGNQLWVKLRVSNNFYGEQRSPTFSSFSASGVECGSFTLDLASVGLGTASCGLYIAYPIHEPTSSVSVICTPASWWPYADQAGNPVYNETTGLPL
jgi:hypothetical protein